MGNTESRISPSEIRKCIDAIEDELLTGEYDNGVTPESVVLCLRTLYMAVEKDGGNIVVPKAVGVAYERDVVITCFPRTRSTHSSTSFTSRGWVRTPRRPPSSVVSDAVEVPPGQRTAVSASEARKIRMAKRAESRRRAYSARSVEDDMYAEQPALQRRTSRARAPSRSAAVDNDTPGYHTAVADGELTDATLSQIAGLNISKQQNAARNDDPVFRGPPAQRGVRERARFLENRG